MPQHIVEITVFLASPGDVLGERKAVRSAVREINRTSGEHEGWRLNVKGWETYTRPAATQKGRAQDAIFEQIGRFDIFVGIMSARVGTPTGRAASGTIEEYEEARRQWSRKRKYKPSVMFYFKSKLTAAIDAIDGDQIKAVQAFKRRVFQDGLAAEYRTIKAFEAMMREHLTKEARAIAKQKPASRSRRTPPASPAPKRSRAPSASSKKAAPKRRVRKPSLPVPKVPRKLTDADRKAFAMRAFNACLREFRVAAKAFNDSHPHASITVKRESDTALTVTGEANGQQVTSTRVSVSRFSHSNYWTLDYESASRGFGIGGQQHFQRETYVRTNDDGYTPVYQCDYQPFESGQRESTVAMDVARLYWGRFVKSFTERRF